MPLQDLPNGFISPTRQDVIDSNLRSVKIRQPGALVGAGTKPLITAEILADQLMPLYADAASVARNVDIRDKTFAALQDEAALMGLPSLLPAAGGSGAITISASAGGTYLLQHDTIADDLTGLKFEVAQTALYLDQQPVPIIGVDTGPSTNLAAGTVMRWQNLRAGCGTIATVTARADGEGLIGGRNEETQAELLLRVQNASAHPAAAGNDGEYLRRVVETPGVGIEAVFVHPCIFGPGTTGIAFTIRAATLGGSRAPTAAQRAAVLAYIQGLFPKDDGIFIATLLEVPVELVLQVAWDPNAPGWTDQSTWPVLESPLVTVSAVTDATHFTVTGVNQPPVGAHFAFYNAVAKTFVKKTVLAVSGSSGAWVVTCDTSVGASDLSYVPSIGVDNPCPWSDSLQDLVAPTLGQFRLLGPGEQVATFFDAGGRQKRIPLQTSTWPSSLSTRNVAPLLQIPSVADLSVNAPTLPHACPVGSPGFTSNLLTPGQLIAFPL